MSTHLAEPGQSDAEERITLKQLHGYFHAGAKAPSQWRVGAEFEKFALEESTGRQLGYFAPGGAKDTLTRLAEHFAWQTHHEGEHLTALSRNGATISLEPGGQVELSTPPVVHLHEVEQEILQHRRELLAVSQGTGVAWVATGVTPISRIDDVPLGPRDRHYTMAEYLPTRSPTALAMMKGTASTQVAFDYSDEDDAIRKFHVALVLGPVINAIWANSALFEGSLRGWVSERCRIWHGMDQDRCGLLIDLLDDLSFDRWLDYLLDVPMLFHVRDGVYQPAEGTTFRKYLQEGIAGRFPSKRDWEIHLTTVFPQVRLKHFLEVRGADANPPELALAVPALWKGLFYNAASLAAAEALTAEFPAAELPKVWEAAAREGLQARHHNRPLLDYARDIAKISASGLKAQQEESQFLDPVFAILDEGQSPAMQTLASFTPSRLTEFLTRHRY